MKQSKTKTSQKPKDKPKNFNPSDLGDHPTESFDDLLDRLGIEKWDWLLVGDGSGSGHDHPCGWGCVSVEKAAGYKRLVWYGGMNRGTVNMAEMLAYLQPLSWIAEVERAKKGQSSGPRFVDVHIVTDSEYCASQGAGGNLMPKTHGMFWRLFEEYQRHGLILHWHWKPRTDVCLNVYADAVSKAARDAILTNCAQKRVERDTETGAVLRNVYEFNPGFTADN